MAFYAHIYANGEALESHLCKGEVSCVVEKEIAYAGPFVTDTKAMEELGRLQADISHDPATCSDCQD